MSVQGACKSIVWLVCLLTLGALVLPGCKSFPTALVEQQTAALEATRIAPRKGAAVPSEVREYELPPLPYPYHALKPIIPEVVLRVHHQEHHAGYVKGLNRTLKLLAAARADGDYKYIRALSRDLAFYGSGHVLHSLYWASMTPGGSTLADGALRGAIVRDFGSFKTFRAQFIAATNAVEGSGWGMLAYEPAGERLVILQVENHQYLTFHGVVPLMVCDVWEHAYYLKYKNRRAYYVENFFKIIDWASVEKRYAAAVRRKSSE